MPEDTPPAGDNSKLESLRAHLDRIAELVDLDQSVKRDIACWILANGPYANPRQLEQRLSKTGIPAFEQRHQRAVANSFRGAVARRPFLAAVLGATSLASLGVGVRLLLQPAEPNDVAAPTASNQPLQPLFLEVNTRRQTIGQTLAALVDRQPVRPAHSGDAGANWNALVHALDMSNWIEAADFLYGSDLWRQVEPAAADPAVAAVTSPLLVLHRAWDYLLRDRPHWRHELFTAYAFGKMPTLAAPGQGEHRYPGGDAAARRHIDAINGLARTFNLLEILNQRYQQPATTTSGAPVRFTQGHNFTYAHASAALADADRFPPARRRLLVNWDAHADLATPFDNPRVNLQDPCRLLQSAQTFDQRLAITSYMSIAGWILALVYQGQLDNGSDGAELLWITPHEAQETSHGYIAPYGHYTITVGDWTLPDRDQIEQISVAPVGDWDTPGEMQVRSYSDTPTLATVTTPDVLANQRRLRVHILSPDDAADIAEVVGDAQIFLSGDVDYSGTQEPGLRPRKGHLPHYPLNASPAEEARHRQLISQFGDFYRQYQGQVRAVSIANSPNFTVDEATRKPAADLLRAVTGNDAASQPSWIEAEWNRVATPTADRASPTLKYALTAGGAAGLAALVGALELHRRRVNELRSLGESSES